MAMISKLQFQVPEVFLDCHFCSIPKIHFRAQLNISDWKLLKGICGLTLLTTVHELIVECPRPKPHIASHSGKTNAVHANIWATIQNLLLNCLPSHVPTPNQQVDSQKLHANGTKLSGWFCTFHEVPLQTERHLYQEHRLKVCWNSSTIFGRSKHAWLKSCISLYTSAKPSSTKCDRNGVWSSSFRNTSAFECILRNNHCGIIWTIYLPTNTPTPLEPFGLVDYIEKWSLCVHWNMPPTMHTVSHLSMAGEFHGRRSTTKKCLLRIRLRTTRWSCPQFF